jgi:hypothetical protein
MARRLPVRITGIDWTSLPEFITVVRDFQRLRERREAMERPVTPAAPGTRTIRVERGHVHGPVVYNYDGMGGVLYPQGHPQNMDGLDK